MLYECSAITLHDVEGISYVKKKKEHLRTIQKYIYIYASLSPLIVFFFVLLRVQKPPFIDLGNWARVG